MENSKKRSREEELADSSPEDPKRARPDLGFEILDDDDDDDVSSGVDSLADVIKSLEEEISPPALEPALPNLGYLLEASDDELGLPPTVGSDTPGSDGGDAVEVVDERIWEFEDEISVGYEGFGFGFGFGFGSGFVDPEAEDGGSGFDYSVYEEVLWRPESQPTV